MFILFSNCNSYRPFNKGDLGLRYSKLGCLGQTMGLVEEAESGDSGHQRKRLSALKHILKGEIENKYTDTQT